MKREMLIIFLAIFLSVSFSYANSNLFYPYVTFPTGSSPEAVAIGDVNGDGRNDVVMTTSQHLDPENDHHIHVFLQNASGELDLPIKYPTNSSSSNFPSSIDIGDMNNDGRADVVVGNSGSNIEVFLQNATGSLDAGISYNTVNSHSVKIGDLNNDGLLDLVGIGGGETNNVHIFFQNTDGTLSPPVAYSIIHSGEVEVGDVNNDGLTDVIVMRGQGIGILPQNPDGTFATPIYYALPGNQWSAGVAVGDVNSDNLLDVVVTYGGNLPSSKIGVFTQNMTGTLNPAVSYGSYDIPEPVVIADVNNDGRKDVILAHGGWEALGVYLQGTNGSLLSEQLYPLPQYNASHYNPQGLAVGDINGDGLNDVVIADYNYGLVVLHKIETISPPTAPSGPNRGLINVSQTYRTGGSLSNAGHPIQYFFDWGDGTNSGWLPVGQTSALKSWALAGTFLIKARARCATHNSVTSNWSGTHSVTISLPCSDEVTLVSPSGTITTATPTYTWNADPYAAWYRLWIDDSTGHKFDQWYTAVGAGCPSGTGNCSVILTTPLATGAAQWKVETYGNCGFGPWSSPTSFTVKCLDPPILSSPSGTIAETAPTYTWSAVPGATYYQLVVNDSTGTKIQQWYSAAAVGCPGRTGSCSVKPPTVLAVGAAQWKIQTYGTCGLDAWSAPLSFRVKCLDPPTLISPSGTVTTSTPFYTWNAVSGATWYRLVVSDSTGTRIQQWYSAGASGCSSGTGTCSVTPGYCPGYRSSRMEGADLWLVWS